MIYIQTIVKQRIINSNQIPSQVFNNDKRKEYFIFNNP